MRAVSAVDRSTSVVATRSGRSGHTSNCFVPKPAALGDSFNILHASAWETSHRDLDTTATGGGAGRYFELALEINIDVHQNPEHDVLIVSSFLG